MHAKANKSVTNNSRTEFNNKISSIQNKHHASIAGSLRFFYVFCAMRFV